MGLQLYHGASRASGGESRWSRSSMRRGPSRLLAFGRALGDPVRLVIVPRVRAGLPVPRDPDLLRQVLAVDPNAVGVALGDPPARAGSPSVPSSDDPTAGPRRGALGPKRRRAAADDVAVA